LKVVCPVRVRMVGKPEVIPDNFRVARDTGVIAITGEEPTE